MEDNRVSFIRWILGEDDGYVSVASRHAQLKQFNEHIFPYPSGIGDLTEYIRGQQLVSDLYFCPTVLRDRKRVKENIGLSTVLWSDLDECPPDQLLVPPTVTVETSPDRFQAYWKLKEPVAALDAETINRRIAYYHQFQGADKSGWDLTQLLRIPGTRNFKREIVGPVRLKEYFTDRSYTLEDFDCYPEEAGYQSEEVPFPDELPLQTGEELLELVRTSVSARAWTLFEQIPIADWSKALWQLQLMLADVGCTREQIFIIARDAACNKYKRDQPHRADKLLWREVCRAYSHSKNTGIALAAALPDQRIDVADQPLLSQEEIKRANNHHTIIDAYVNWAKTTGDAAEQYHVAGAFIILSSMMASAVRLPTSFGPILPNLWFMITADTTLTRKSTAMDLATDIITEIDDSILLATDGSIEGLMTSLAARPNRSSVFLRDEFTGLLSQMRKRDYYAGMQETFTKLYDGKLQKRVLRKEIITVKDPVLLIFAGGIKSKIYELISPEDISSGFLPRFCFIAAESDVNKIKPLGPPVRQTRQGRDALIGRFAKLYLHYKVDTPTIDNPFPKNSSVDVMLTDAAWKLYNRLDATLTEIGFNSNQNELMTPMMARLAMSGLKAAVLIAASRKLANEVIVEEIDILKAFTHVNDWKVHAINLVLNAGKSPNEKRMEKVYQAIVEAGANGMIRSKLMQMFVLTSKDANAVFDTLIQRGLIRVDASRGARYYATSITNVVNTKGIPNG